VKIYLPKVPTEQEIDRIIEWLEILGPAIALSQPKKAFLIYDALQVAVAFLKRLRQNNEWRREGIIKL